MTNDLKRIGYEIHTLDIYKNQNVDPDICIFLDMPTFSTNKIINKKKTKSIVMLREAEIINKINYDKKRHQEFDFILTWKNSLINNKKYFFFPSTRYVFSGRATVKDYLDRKLCVLINSNLSSKIKGELYSHRFKIIRWFEKKYINDFDLYGYGWDKYILKIRNKTIFSSKLLAPKRISYKGTVEDKIATISKYKFVICFENANNVEDYISEKIFDCFLASTVPIYLGAPNIEKIIPKECFIDFRQFNSIDEMHIFISSMNSKRYLEYIDNINSYINSDMAKKYSLENWVNSIKKVIRLCNV